MKIRFTALLLLAALAGCDNNTQAPAGGLAQPTFGNATLAGVVHFAGDPPARKMIDTSTCHEGARAYQEETIVVGAGQGLRDVIVYLKDAPASDGSQRPAAALDQVECRYIPHVLAVQVGQPLRITTSDPVYHNVHWVGGPNGDMNLNMPAGSAAQSVTFKSPDFVSLRCDVHAWMGATVGVLPNPFFAVTAPDGTFSIPRVPEGKYTLVAWHALLGTREQSVEVKASGTVTANFEYGPPAR